MANCGITQSLYRPPEDVHEMRRDFETPGVSEKLAKRILPALLVLEATIVGLLIEFWPAIHAFWRGL